MCNKFNYFLWRWVRWRDFLMKHTVKLVKLSTAILLLTTATMFGLDEARIIDLPDFHKFSHFDAWSWAAIKDKLNAFLGKSVGFFMPTVFKDS